MEPLARSLTAQAAPLSTPVPPKPTYTYYLCDLLAGRILTELPLETDKITRVIAREDQQTFTLPTADPACPDDWANLLLPGKTMIVLAIDDAPTQAWPVIEAVVGDVVVQISAFTLEHCLGRTYVPTLDATLDNAEVAATIAAPLIVRFGFTIEHTNTGHIIDASYDNTQDQTLLAALNDLMAAADGPEWRVGVRWTDENTKTGFTKVLTIAAQIGMDRPDAVFDLDADGRGSIDTYARTSSYALGKGATMLIGTSEGSGQSRPMTDPKVSALVAAGWPIWEERANFSGLDQGSVEDEDDLLNQRTDSTLIQRELGATAWTLTGNDLAPVPGRDYAEGDTVHIDVAPQGKADPIGGTAAIRVLGWELDPVSGRGTPIVWEPPDDEGVA